MMDVEISVGAAKLTSPTIPLQHLLPKRLVFFHAQP
jgi:hypothetical protein